MGGYYNLKALIKAIRACKTLADERVVIDRESAAIRESFRDEDVFARHASIEKLLYIFMLGYKAHYGQIECLKLVASPRFADKRLGYLGIMLLLDENTELLTMVTNSLKNDMNHANMYIVGLALCTFANISSEEMSRDLSNEVEKLLGSSNVYIRKKAALCAMRIVRKVPDLIDHFVHRATSLLSDRNHGVLLCGVTLVTDMCAADPQVAEGFRKAVPLLVRHLKALVTTGYSPEHDVSGITDPFLQVKILRLLRILGKGDVEASESMNDILAQVATNTEGAKNVGNAILYEAVLTILDIEAESSLRVLAINILGKFLSNRDNNIRYVALNTLNKVVSMDTNAVQRHRTIILDCLRDGDISIRRRALELSYALINDSNVRVLTKELLSFLEVADNEFKLGMTTQIGLAAERFAPNKRWHIDTVLSVLKLAGNYVREDVLASFIRLVAHTPELQGYAAHQLYSALKTDLSQDSLTLAGVWTIGEFGDILLQGGRFDESDVSSTVSSSEIIDLFESILLSPYVNATIRQFAITACTKLSTRFTSGQNDHSRLSAIVQRYTASSEVEIQQRAVEFGRLLQDVDPTIRSGVLERMPPPELKATVIGTVSEKRAVGSTKNNRDALLDLMGENATNTSSTQASVSVQQSARDLLADLFGDEPAPTAPAPQQTSSSVNNHILGLFGASPVTNTTSDQTPSVLNSKALPATVAPKSYTAYEGHGLKVTLAPSKDAKSPNVTNFLLTFQASGSGGIQGINFQAAVPKTQKLQMMAISSADIPSDGQATQQMRVMAQPEAQIRLRLRIGFVSEGSQRQEQTDFALPLQ